MKKLIRNLVIFSIAISVASTLVCCTTFRDVTYRKQMEYLRSVVSPGDNIYAAKKKIEGSYPSVSKIYDPTGTGDTLWMNVDFGLRPTALETFSYMTDIRMPFDKNEGLGALIKADPSGTIREIR